MIGVMELGDHQEQIGGIDHTSRTQFIGASELWCCYLTIIFKAVRTMVLFSLNILCYLVPICTSSAADDRNMTYSRTTILHFVL